MTSITNTANKGKWGKETEKKIGVEDLESWQNEMYVNTIPWEYDRFRELLEGYSKIPRNEIEAEIFKIVRKRNLPYQIDERLSSDLPFLTITLYSGTRLGNSSSTPASVTSHMCNSPNLVTTSQRCKTLSSA